ncbi:DNA-binding transcriptional LysR family regulator [Streptomyces afghaniensis]|nr:DNA-binding transcriptional LysR family regulator [Streptomyces afghaniensis]
MDERQLRILRELGELGSVTAVAEALLVTPSAISQQLRLLQRAIPVPLTERQGRRLVLTDAGQALAGAAVEVETALARARHTVEEFVGAPDAEVSVAAFHSAGAAFFPPLLRALAGAGKPVPRLADEDVPQEDFPRLTREYDVVLAHRLDHAPPWPDTVATTTLLREPLDVAMPADHPWPPSAASPRATCPTSRGSPCTRGSRSWRRSRPSPPRRAAGSISPTASTSSRWSPRSWPPGAVSP